MALLQKGLIASFNQAPRQVAKKAFQSLTLARAAQFRQGSAQTLGVSWYACVQKLQK